MNPRARDSSRATAVRVPVGDQVLDGDLSGPAKAQGLVVFAHGSGSSRHSPRNQYVARVLEGRGLATLLIDLLTPHEEEIDNETRHLRFDIPLLAGRVAGIIEWLKHETRTEPLAIGLFGASTGGGAALMAAAARPEDVGAVVSRGGRPDLAGGALPHVKAPTLFIVGERDEAVAELNRDAMSRMRAEVSLVIVQNATHLFEEPGALECVADLAATWFGQHLKPAQSPPIR
jgi:dienelactone hydrolase